MHMCNYTHACMPLAPALGWGRYLTNGQKAKEKAPFNFKIYIIDFLALWGLSLPAHVDARPDSSTAEAEQAYGKGL